MGCFNTLCSVSNKTIERGDNIVLLLDRTFGFGLLPFYGSYNDYGGINLKLYESLGGVPVLGIHTDDEDDCWGRKSNKDLKSMAEKYAKKKNKSKNKKSLDPKFDLGAKVNLFNDFSYIQIVRHNLLAFKALAKKIINLNFNLDYCYRNSNLSQSTLTKEEMKEKFRLMLDMPLQAKEYAPLNFLNTVLTTNKVDSKLLNSNDARMFFDEENSILFNLSIQASEPTKEVWANENCEFGKKPNYSLSKYKELLNKTFSYKVSDFKEIVETFFIALNKLYHFENMIDLNKEKLNLFKKQDLELTNLQVLNEVVGFLQETDINNLRSVFSIDGTTLLTEKNLMKRLHNEGILNTHIVELNDVLESISDFLNKILSFVSGEESANPNLENSINLYLKSNHLSYNELLNTYKHVYPNNIYNISNGRVYPALIDRRVYETIQNYSTKEDKLSGYWNGYYEKTVKKIKNELKKEANKVVESEGYVPKITANSFKTHFEETFFIETLRNTDNYFAPQMKDIVDMLGLDNSQLLFNLFELYGVQNIKKDEKRLDELKQLKLNLNQLKIELGLNSNFNLDRLELDKGINTYFNSHDLIIRLFLNQRPALWETRNVLTYLFDDIQLIEFFYNLNAITNNKKLGKKIFNYEKRGFFDKKTKKTVKNKIAVFKDFSITHLANTDGEFKNFLALIEDENYQGIKKLLVDSPVWGYVTFVKNVNNFSVNISPLTLSGQSSYNDFYKEIYQDSGILY